MNFVWSPLTYGSTAISSAIYPGNEYVDVVALDAYNWNNNSQPTGDYATLFGSYYDTVMSLCGGMKPFMVAEFGCAEGSAVMAKDAWFQDTFDTDMPTRTPKLKYSAYFDADFSAQGEMDWRVNSTEAARLSFVDILDDPQNMAAAELGNFPARFVTATMGGSGAASHTTTISRPTVTLDPQKKQILIFKLHNGGAVFTSSGQDPHPPAGSDIQLLAQMSDGYIDPPANTSQNANASTIATVFYKVVDGTEPLSWLFDVTLGAATSAWAWSVELWENVDTANPFEASIQISYIGDAPASVTRLSNLPLPITTQPDTVVSWIVTTQNTATAPAQAPAPNLVQDPSVTTPETWPDNIIERYRSINYVTPGSGTSNARTAFSFDKVMPAAGTVGDFDILSDIATRFVAIGFGIRSAGVPAAPLETGSLAPDAFVGTPLNLTGSITAIQDDPDAPDGNWLLAP